MNSLESAKKVKYFIAVTLLYKVINSKELLNNNSTGFEQTGHVHASI